jgi:energy-coupling factor transport system permease protein
MALLQDITLGRYVPAESLLHRLDPRTKFVSVLALMIAVLSASAFVPLFFFGFFLSAAIAQSGLPVGLVLRNLRPFLWLFFFTFALHALLTPGQALWVLPYGDFAVTREGLARGAFFSLRLSAVIVTASLMTLTTAPLELTSGLERLLGPLRRFGFPAHELALMVTISLRFIPVLIDEAERLRKAQLARGADFSGGPIRRARNLVPLLVPLFVSAFARADRLAMAMESRCYRGGAARTSFRELRFGRRDLGAGLAVLATVAGIWWLSRHPVS